jgi:hypothetical protein
LLPGLIGTVALSTACARAMSVNLTSPVGGVAKAVVTERTLVTAAATTIVVLRMW